MNRAFAILTFFTIVTTILGSIHYYLWLRLVRDAGLSAPWHQLATTAILLLCLSMPLTMFLSRGIPFEFAKVVAWGPFVWMGVMLLLLTTFAAVDTVRLGAGIARLLAWGETNTPDPGRRLLLGRFVAGGAFLAAGGLSAVAIGRATRRATIQRLDVALPRLPPALDGLKVVQISDLHIGLMEGREWLEVVVREVNALDPDIVAITGDLIDGYVAQLKQEIAPLAGLRARYGVFFVTGNHEYYFNVEDWLPEIEKLGVRVLRNERVRVGIGDDTFYLAGIDDHDAGRLAPGHGPDLNRALAGRDPEREVVLLAHQPRSVGMAAEQNVSLMLAGHTHGGQIWPFNYLVRLQQPYTKGLWEHTEKTRLYVHQGTGTWGPPMRLGTENEIALIRLRAGDGSGPSQKDAGPRGA